MNCWNFWKLGLRDFICPLSSVNIGLNLNIGLHVEEVLLKALALLAPATLNQHPFFVIDSLY